MWKTLSQAKQAQQQIFSEIAAIKKLINHPSQNQFLNPSQYSISQQPITHEIQIPKNQPIECSTINIPIESMTSIEEIITKIENMMDKKLSKKGQQKIRELYREYSVENNMKSNEKFEDSFECDERSDPTHINSGIDNTFEEQSIQVFGKHRELNCIGGSSKQQPKGVKSGLPSMNNMPTIANKRGKQNKDQKTYTAIHKSKK